VELIFLGTGTSQGVPVIAFDGHHCDLTNPKNWRTRTSVHVVMGGVRIQVDAAPEFRLQCVWNRIPSIDCFILTHGHSDHIAGMDDLRRFCDLRDGDALPVYSTEEGVGRVRAVFPYAIGDRPKYKGYPAFRPLRMPGRLELPGGTIDSFPLPHGSIDVLGLVFEERGTGKRIAYFTDCHEVGEAARARARGADMLVIDALRPEPHPTHLSISEALAVAADVGARRTYFTHMTHRIDHERLTREMSPGVGPAWDGLRVEV
jgi:phosphoribosyl 1,2-cyclic phosphate phosphodiesterase